MDAKLAERRGLQPLGIFRGFAVAGCEPDEMGVGPIHAVPRLLKRTGYQVSDIDLWELNEAFACQVLYCRDQLGIPDERLNVNGGAIAVGHPYGVSGARLTGHALIEGQASRRQARGRDHVHRRRPGSGWVVRGGVESTADSRVLHVGSTLQVLAGSRDAPPGRAGHQSVLQSRSVGAAPSAQARPHLLRHADHLRRAVRRGERIAGYLQHRCGVRKGDRVLLFMQNSPQFVIAYYGILRANAVVVPLNPMYLTQEFLRAPEGRGRDHGHRVPGTVFAHRAAAGAAATLLSSMSSSPPTSDYLKAATDLAVPDFIAAPRAWSWRDPA
jgi:hypothetical protein